MPLKFLGKLARGAARLFGNLLRGAVRHAPTVASVIGGLLKGGAPGVATAASAVGNLLGGAARYAPAVVPAVGGLLGQRGARKDFEAMMAARRGLVEDFDRRYNVLMDATRRSVAAKADRFRSDFEKDLRQSFATAGFGLYGTPHMAAYSKFISDRLIPFQKNLIANLERDRLTAISNMMAGNIDAGEKAIANVRRAEGSMWESLAGLAGRVVEGIVGQGKHTGVPAGHAGVPAGPAGAAARPARWRPAADTFGNLLRPQARAAPARGLGVGRQVV